MIESPLKTVDSRDGSRESSGSRSHISDTYSTKVAKAQKYFKKKHGTKRGRSKLFQEILKKDYSKFFVGGFSLSNYD
jgi:hypothetical protein